MNSFKTVKTNSNVTWWSRRQGRYRNGTVVKASANQLVVNDSNETVILSNPLNVTLTSNYQSKPVNKAAKKSR